MWVSAPGVGAGMGMMTVAASHVSNQLFWGLVAGPRKVARSGQAPEPSALLDLAKEQAAELESTREYLKQFSSAARNNIHVMADCAAENAARLDALRQMLSDPRHADASVATMTVERFCDFAVAESRFNGVDRRRIVAYLAQASMIAHWHFGRVACAPRVADFVQMLISEGLKSGDKQILAEAAEACSELLPYLAAPHDVASMMTPEARQWRKAFVSFYSNKLFWHTEGGEDFFVDDQVIPMMLREPAFASAGDIYRAAKLAGATQGRFKRKGLSADALEALHRSAEGATDGVFPSAPGILAGMWTAIKALPDRCLQRA